MVKSLMSWPDVDFRPNVLRFFAALSEESESDAILLKESDKNDSMQVPASTQCHSEEPSGRRRI